MIDAACHIDGKKYKDGDEWTYKEQFIMSCIGVKPANDPHHHFTWSTKVVACLGENGRRIRIGETVVEGDTEWACTADSNGGNVNLKKKTKIRVAVVGGK
uniref:Abnormal cell migration protein 18-like fibronectin type I domain-containing protein n=1 Tax=Plectus sambesii TaxID=2011161 RepID=A0A914WNK8_9BILA